MKHVVGDIVCQFLDRLAGISHCDFCVNILKHSQIIVAVSKTDSIFPGNLEGLAENLDPEGFGKSFWNKFNRRSDERAFMMDGIIPVCKLSACGIGITSRKDFCADFIDFHR